MRGQNDRCAKLSDMRGDIRGRDPSAGEATKERAKALAITPSSGSFGMSFLDKIQEPEEKREGARNLQELPHFHPAKATDQLLFIRRGEARPQARGKFADLAD
jgi:hypothetical protein